MGFYFIGLLYFYLFYGVLVAGTNFGLALIRWNRAWIGSLVAITVSSILGTLGWIHCQL